jgi:hypothetical protein
MRLPSGAESITIAGRRRTERGGTPRLLLRRSVREARPYESDNPTGSRVYITFGIDHEFYGEVVVTFRRRKRRGVAGWGSVTVTGPEMAVLVQRSVQVTRSEEPWTV